MRALTAQAMTALMAPRTANRFLVIDGTPGVITH
jgi:hypothetical protein